ncbi:hypothetical protein HNP38_000255 [Chryseobacterium defluvii]|uniref:Acyltransferase 3 domain-containing protein n=1 Tax=Chryseobacterium defluvii TaxID=160396 RepID=A0A840KBS1_9FLAO|nr:acyltransferase family protein [Chryseobacterium defluvii]MBB4804983.1 hypothetical protein [Chryseobacterium defluvii]
MTRNLSIDLLKIVLAIFVVFLHSHLLRNSYPSLSYVLVNGLFRIAVPVFLIITGYYFYDVDTPGRLKKWSLRLFLLYLIWTVAYIPFWKDGKHLSHILFGYHHLWYLIGTLFSGLILFAVKKKRAGFLLRSIFPLFSCGYILQLLGNLHYFQGNTDLVLNFFPVYRNFLFVCFPFLTLGFLIKKLEIDIKYKPSLLLVILAVSLVMAEAFINYRIIHLSKNESIDLLYSLLLACPLLFLYCKNIPLTTNSKILASISTAIYLIHPLLMKLVFKSVNIHTNEIIVFTVLLLVGSFMLVYANRKLKYIL